jgi:hypothetical protein
LALLVLYPLQAWRDAPVFPTPRNALQGLAAELPLAPGAAILDLCGRCVTNLHGGGEARACA